MAAPALNSFRFPTPIVFESAFMAGAGAIAAEVLTTISPLGGAVFGVSHFLSSRLIDWTIEKVGCCSESLICRISKFVLSTLGGIAAAVLITTAIGFPMTLTSGVYIAVATMGASIAAILVFRGCLCSSAITAGLLFGGNDGSIRV